MNAAYRILTAILMTLVLCGCHSHTGPSDMVTGNWKGTIVDAVSGTGTFEATIDRKGPGISGTWSARFQTGGEQRSGSLGGTLVDTKLVIVFSYNPPMVCANGATIESTMAFEGTLRADAWSGSYVTLTCSNVRTGSIDVTRP
jgi:hypothetical protein